MKARTIGIGLAFLGALSAASVASAQSFLEKITKQLQQSAAVESAPPLQPAGNPPSANPRDTLPPPRELSPTPAAARGSLGIRVSEVTEEAVRAQKLVVRRGALITSIVRGSVADRAGLPLGAVIVALDGRRIDSPQDLVDAVRSTGAGRDVEVTYYQGERLMRKTVHLDANQLPEVAASSERRITPVPNPPAIQPPSQPLGSNNNRPLLNRLGRVLESVVAPATAIEPDPAAPAPVPTVANRVDPHSELSQLRTQVDQLQRQVDRLQKSIDLLERRLAEKQ